MNNIKKILNDTQVKQNKEYNINQQETAKDMLNNLLLTITKYNIISNNIDDVEDDIFELRFSEGNTKQEILKRDIDNFIDFLIKVKDIDSNLIYKEMIDFYKTQKNFIDLNDYITKEKDTKYMENLFYNLYKEIKYIEEFEIIKNRISFFMNCDSFFKSTNDLKSFVYDKEQELLKEVDSFFLDQKKFFKFLKKDKIKEINSLHNVYNKEDIDKKEQVLLNKIKELESKIKNMNGVG